MFTKFYDFSFFSFFHYIFYFTLLLSTFPRRLVSGVVGGQIRGLSGGEQLAPVSWQKSTMISTEPSGYFEASGHTDEANNYLLRTAF